MLRLARFNVLTADDEAPKKYIVGLPVPVAARYRGFHRFDLTTCIACDQCAKACPVDCIYIGKERVEGSKGFKITGYTIDYTKCMFCALCVEPCPVDCIFMGSNFDLSTFGRDGCIVDYAKLPLEVASGQATLNPTAVMESKRVSLPVWTKSEAKDQKPEASTASPTSA